MPEQNLPITPLLEVLAAPSDRGAELHYLAQQMFSHDNDAALTTVKVDDDTTMLVTPSFSPHRDLYSHNIDRAIASRSYSVACQIDSTRAGRSRKGNPLYLIVDGKYHNPQLSFSMTANGLERGNGYESVDDNSVDVIMAGINSKITTVINQERQKRQTRHAENMWRLRVAGYVGTGVLALGGVVTGITALVHNHHVHQHQSQAREAQRRQAYDAAGHVIADVPEVSVATPQFVPTQPLFFSNYIPPLHAKPDKGIVASPRKLSVDGGTCTNVGNVAAGKSVLLTTDAPYQQMLASVSGTGTVEVCVFGQPPIHNDHGDKIQPSYQVAVELAD
ncbi:MAG: hypothetical protein JWN38_417 [Candidatus Saccharibacteria bacterium]|nr:hypothetical protein [Candidatus Saccharibacteria bacterium]